MSWMKIPWRLTCVGALLLLAAATPLLARTTVSGRVVTEDGKPVQRAKIEAFDQDRRLTPFPQPTDLQGRFEILFPSFSGDRVKLAFSAPNFESTKLTVLVSEGRAEAGDVFLISVPTISVGELHHFLAADNASQGIDLFVRKEASQPIEIHGVKILGTRRKETGCLTGAPSFILDFQPNASGDQWVTEISQPNSDWKDSVQAKATIEILPCSQIRAVFEVPILFQVDSEESKKLRIQLPRKVETAGDEGPEEKLLDLEVWSSVTVELLLKNGHRVVASLPTQPEPLGLQGHGH